MAKSKSGGKAKNKFDIQQFLLAKGEKIAMVVAGIGLALLALLGILAATHANSPNELSAKLKEGSQKIDSRLAQSPEQKPDAITLPEGGEYELVTVDRFKTPSDWFNTASNIIDKRVNPIILAATEGNVSFAIGGVGVWSVQGDKIAVIENRQQAKANNYYIKTRKKGGQVKAGPPAAQVPPPVAPPPQVPAGPMGKAAGPRAGIAQTGRSGEPEIVYLPTDSPQLEKAVLAINCQPIRMAVVEGIVPYKMQVDEYLRKLRLENDSALEAEGLAPSYRGLIVERQVVPPDGTTDPEKWLPFDHITTIKDLYSITAEFVDEDPRYAAFIPDPAQKLYLKRPKFVRGGYAPTNLTQLGKALQEMEKTGPPKVLTGKQARIAGEEDIFDPQNLRQTGPTIGPGGGPGFPSEGKGPLGDPRAGKSGGPMMAVQQPRNNASPVWKFQFIDTTIEPGKCYRYRVKFKAFNPNYGKRDQVAIPSAATEDELVSDWAEIPGFVTIPSDEYLYANGERHTDRAQIGSSSFDTTTLKFHHWYDFIRVNRETTVSDPIAEWVVADIEGKRGQLVHQNKAMKVPLWSMLWNSYIFRDKTSTSGKPLSIKELLKRENVRMDLSPRVDTYLVDFEGGKGAYRLPTAQNVNDECVAEVLLLSDHAGTLKLTSYNTATDKDRDNRMKRESDWTAWLAEVENASKTAATATSTSPSGAPTPSIAPGG